VFKGRVSGVVIAIKEIQLKTLADERNTVREVEMLMALDHPHVVKALGESNGPSRLRAMKVVAHRGVMAARLAMILLVAPRGARNCFWSWPTAIWSSGSTREPSPGEHVPALPGCARGLTWCIPPLGPTALE
jgi:hypothetical protein